MPEPRAAFMQARTIRSTGWPEPERASKQRTPGGRVLRICCLLLAIAPRLLEPICLLLGGPVCQPVLAVKGQVADESKQPYTPAQSVMGGAAAPSSATQPM